ncbi:PREDICTED: transcriptional regulator ATRX-like isoform X2 [Polistes dominula]|uniref:ATP-dependent helicase ATRX n=1 Tax=Polistes dominula TaxID=743375 RepID=A0ABM1IJV1_POLDO|nr:PREDICTED: transcriptional regulator ATRX-like isoform X2 [Polistes dominula]
MVKEPKIKKSSHELAYRTENYHGIKILADREITCTACGNKVITKIGKIFTNPVIGTLLCEKCWDHFNNTNFSLDKDNNLDKYCRLCARENNLFYCGSSNCTFAFCKRCIKRNAPLCLLDIEKKSWKCFICEPKPLWELRAVCDSIMDCLAKKNKAKCIENEFKKRDTRLPYQKYQSQRVKQMQNILQSICDKEEEDDEDIVKNRPLYSMFFKKKESNETTKKSNKSKSHTLNQLCSTSSSSNSSDNEIKRKESSKQDKDVIISSSYSSNVDSNQSESVSRIKHKRSPSKRDKANVNKISNRDETIESSSESSEEEGRDDSKNKNKILLNRSNKKKCSMKKSTNEEILMSQSSIDSDSSSATVVQHLKRSSTCYTPTVNITCPIEMYSSENIMNKQQAKYFKSNVAEILDELKQQCSVFELQAQHIENKFRRKPMYVEDADKIIYKSKSAINKIITKFNTYKEHLNDFYKTFVSSVKEEEGHKSSEDDTTLINKKPHKRKSSDTINKNNSKSVKDKNNVISDCDSEIFSENESIKHRAPAEKIKTNVCDNKKNLDSEELRVSENVSPILGSNQHNKRTLVKLSNNELIKDNINSKKCVENDDKNITRNSNVTECNIPNTESKNILNKRLTAVPSNVTSNLTNDSLNDIFDNSLELNNELNESNTTAVNVQKNKDIQDLSIDEGQKESNEDSNTWKCNKPKENVQLSDKKEFDLLEKEEQNKESIFRKKTPDIFGSNKSDSNSNETVFNEYTTEQFHIHKPNKKVSKTLAKQGSNECDSDTSNISDKPFNSKKVSNKSKDPIKSIDENKSNITKEITDINNDSDNSTVVLSNLNTIEELTSDNVAQHNSENHIKEKCSSVETNILDGENEVNNEESIKNALLESDSDDYVSSSDNKEVEINMESKNKDLNKLQLTTFDNDSTKSEDLPKLQIQMNNIKSEKKELGKKRNYDFESDTSVGSRVKRRRLQLNKNFYYMNDKKLRMICHVQLELLTDDVLNQYKNALEESKEYQNNKKINRLINLDTLEKLPHKRSSVTSKEDNLSKSFQSLKTKISSSEKEDSLLEHLKKVQDGSASIDMQDDSDNNEQNLNSLVENHSAILTNDDLILEADKIAKDLLLNSSDSDMDDSKEQEQSSVSDKEEKESLKEKNESIKKNEIKKEEPSEEDNKSSSTEKKEKKLKKRSKWRRNKILTMRISDSESEKEQEKWDKLQEKQRKKEEDDDKDNVDVKTEHKRKKARRIFDSDSDVKEISDPFSNNSSSSSSSSSSEVMILSSSDDSDEEKKKKKKKKKKQSSKKSSDSDSSTTGNKPKPKRRRIKNVSTDSNSDSDQMNNSQGTSSKTGRKNIRKVLKDKQVADDTKQAAKEEEERLKRIMERQKLYNEMYEIRLAGEEKVDKLVLDFDPDTKQELVSVNKDLVKRLKPHQAEGIKFMWDACFESLERIKTTSGSGCIIAHCMGLGKTLQVITLSHTLLTHEETGIKTILVVCPLSTVLNWVNEFEIWLKDVENGGDIDLFELTKCKKNFERKYQLQSWHQRGGVLIIGYEMFRNLTGANKNIRKNMKDAILKCLIDPGPDLIVCDEGHLLKNEDTAISKSMKRVKTLRRIVLTGTPLQNNLIEYHCMVQFVKPNLLGTKREFLNRFVNPITNGQFDNSTEYDVKLMKKRAHVLHKLLKGSIQRFDYSVLTPFLPPKQEYVIFVRLTDVQIKLYQYYLDNLTRQSSGVKGTLFADFQALQRIWTHPVVLQLNSEKVEKANEKKRYNSDSEGSLKNFVVSDDEEETTSSSNSDSDVQSIHSASPIRKRKTRNNDHDSEPELVEVSPEKEEEWWSQFVQPEHFEDMRVSTKLVLLFGILRECEKIGDKVLVFSQSLYSLTLIEQFLAQIDEAEQNNRILQRLEGHTGSWSLGLDYFRLDGQTSAENRSIWCKIFNKPSNTRARLFLISTRAGGLGINLTAANRVIIFDASWNPSHDIQSIFRVYRFGQKKPCYVYRFLASGTMEEKIYNRQVTKLSLSCRVVDEQQIERHYSHNALNELYKFEPHTNTDKPTLNLPKDRLLAEIFSNYKELVENYHEHDSLLENKADEELDEEERKQAWLEYEEEKRRPNINANTAAYQNNILLQQYNTMIANLNRQNIAINANTHTNDYENLQKLIEKDYPNATPEQRKFMTTKALLDMYNYWEQQAMVQPSRNPLLAQNMQNMPNMQNMQNMQNIQNIQKSTTLGTTTAMNQNLLRQHLLQNQQVVNNSNNTFSYVPNTQLKSGIRVINPYAYPKPSTSNVQPRNEISQITIEPAKATETSAKTSNIPTNKEQEE